MIDKDSDDIPRWTVITARPDRPLVPSASSIPRLQSQSPPQDTARDSP